MAGLFVLLPFMAFVRLDTNRSDTSRGTGEKARDEVGSSNFSLYDEDLVFPDWDALGLLKHPPSAIIFSRLKRTRCLMDVRFFSKHES